MATKKAAKSKDTKSVFVAEKALLPFHASNNLVPLGLLLLIPLLLYLVMPCIRDTAHLAKKEFVLDDKMVLSENAYVKRGLDGIPNLLSEDSWQGYLREQYDSTVKDHSISYEDYLKSQESQLPGGRYRPLSLVLFAVVYDAIGLSPIVYFVLNILLYSATGILLFVLLSSLISSVNRIFNIAFITALLFVLHPLHTEVVANIKGCDDVLALLFSLLALYTYLRHLDTGRRAHMIMASLYFFAGLMAKESALTFLLVMPLTARFFKETSVKKAVVAILPVVGITILYLLVRTGAVGYLLDSGRKSYDLMNDPFVAARKGQKVPTIFYTLWMYVRLLFVPTPLTHDYYPYQVPLMGWSDLRATGSFLFYAGLAVYGVYAFIKRRLEGYGILFFLITLSIVSNLFVPVGTFMNERFMYMPSIGFCLCLAMICAGTMPLFTKKPTGRIIGCVLFALCCAGYSWKTSTRTPDWETDRSISFAAADVSTRSARANNFGGYYHYVDATKEKDPVKKKAHLDLASPYIEKALKIYPRYAEALKIKAGIAAAYYETDNDLDKLLNTFYEIQSVQPTPFVATYLKYLEKRADPQKIKAFYARFGM